MPSGQWCYDVPSDRITLDVLPDRAGDDLADDLQATLAALRAYGVPSVIAVDLSPPDLPISVVRAVVPGLETYAFSGHLGPRGRAELNPFTLRA
jgi:ribosomal protein S12 methylthiotransferase accessory factor